MEGIRGLRDIEAIEAQGLPPDLPASTYELIRRGAQRDPAAPALSFFLRADEHAAPETWSYAELLGKLHQTANFFHGLGVGKDGVVAFVLPNLPETHWTIWGGEAAGIVGAINPLLEPDAIAELLNAMQASVLVTLAPFPGVDLWQKISRALPKAPRLRHLVLVNLADRVRGLKHYAARVLAWREARRLHGAGGVRAGLPAGLALHDFGKAVRKQRADALASGRRIEADDLCSYFCTGGTTGVPKVAMRRHRNEVANAYSMSQFLGDGIGAGKTLFCGLPLFHVNAVMVTGLLPFSQGAHVLLGTPQGYRGEGVVKRFWEIIARHRVNFFSGVPTLYAGLMQVPIDGHDLSSLEYGLCGAAPMPVEVFRSFQERTGLKILEGYGLTEGACASSVNPPLGERRLGSIGIRLPFQAMKTVILDADGRWERDCAPGEIGSVLISGPNVFAGYTLAEQNRGLWVDDPEGRRWLNTGDLGRQDADGYFWLTGRKKELIIRGGHNIDPATIEAPLHRHPAVALAAAVGRPDAYAGELPVAYVQLKEGAQAGEQELLQFLQNEIAERAALPKAVHVIEAMPLTPVGKIFKPPLRHREIGAALGEALREAGVQVAALEAAADASRGTVVAVTLAPGASREEARRVLGQFPFAVELA